MALKSWANWKDFDDQQVASAKQLGVAQKDDAARQEYLKKYGECLLNLE